MSDFVLRLIPTNPVYVPDPVAQQAARALLTTFISQADAINAVAADDVQFIDQGDYWQRVLCPACGTELDVGWWQDVMQMAYETNFTDLTVITPCCGTACSLNELVYEWPAGFARFMLEAVNPDVDLNDGQVHALEGWLNCKLRKIWAHY